jgi:4-amino-4-deoxy-L-arabinose transferase-like glycosyltransferase
MKINFVLLTGLIILGFKLLIIDVDPPKHDISRYQPIDETYYVYPAYNYYESTDFFGEDDVMVFGNPIITNVATYFSLLVFGDNYLGLRFSSLLFSMIAFVFFVLILKKLTNNFRLQLAATLFFTLNFSFTTANIIVEPTIARIMAALIALYLVIDWNEKKESKTSNIIWQSALIGLLFLFSYPTNAFIVLAAYITLVVIKQLF